MRCVIGRTRRTYSVGGRGGLARLQPRRAYFTHICHDLGTPRRRTLPAGVELAYDGLQLAVEVA